MIEEAVERMRKGPRTCGYFYAIFADADSENVASHNRYTCFNLAELLEEPDTLNYTP